MTEVIPIKKFWETVLVHSIYEFEKEEVYEDFLLTRELEEELENLDDELQILLRKWEETLMELEKN